MLPCQHQCRQCQDHPQEAAVAADSCLVAEHLQFMQEQEETTYRIPLSADYLDVPSAKVSHADRRTMLDWSFEIVHACAISREVACIGLQYFDRFLCTAAPRAEAAVASRREFQLAFIACLVVALKCRAGMQVDAGFVTDTICQGLYGKEEILGMERDVLAALEWRLNGPSPQEFVAGMVALLPHGAGGAALAKKLTSLSHAQVERSLGDYSVALRRSPSSIAYEALMAAMRDAGAGMFRPLHRLAWMSDIDTVMSRKWTDRVDASPSSPASVKALHCSSAASSLATGTPVTSFRQLEENIERHRPYLDALVTGNNLSPVSSMLDDVS